MHSCHARALVLGLLAVDEEKSHGEAREHDANNRHEDWRQEGSRHAFSVGRVCQSEGSECRHRLGHFRLHLGSLHHWGRPARHWHGTLARHEGRSSCQEGQESNGGKLHLRAQGRKKHKHKVRADQYPNLQSSLPAGTKSESPVPAYIPE